MNGTDQVCDSSQRGRLAAGFGSANLQSLADDVGFRHPAVS